MNDSRHYSLLERFRGTLLGAELGYRLSRSPEDAPIWMGTSEREIAEQFARIKTFKFDLDAVSLAPLFVSLLAAIQFHDDLDRLHEILSAVKPPESIVIALTVASALRDRLDLNSLAEDFTQQHLDPNPWLEPVRHLLDRGSDVETAWRTLSSHPSSFPFALYCILSSGGDWCGSVTRVCRWEIQSATHRLRERASVGIATGAICGAYRTRSNVPVTNWSQLDNLTELDEVAWKLWQGWSGRLEFDDWDGIDRSAVGLAGTLRPRSIEENRKWGIER
ncbi:MAG: hypothetical protein J7641_20720 [Cyanobacteria bacterium SID2]|nr:hypothetical protein [Cyanobacteria bacterium SID2]MBP0006472.1 hypothetical protein [Cyanobacteria bacterium SBC]